MNKWKNFYIKNKGRQPRKLFLDAINFCVKHESALDLGAAPFIETQAILAHGFHNVIAIDSAVDAIEYLPKVYVFDFRHISFRDYDFPVETFDFINAQFSLPFYGKDGFSSFFQTILKSLNHGGVFCGQLFGDRDSWNISESNLVFHKLSEVQALIHSGDTDLIFFSEEEKEASSANETLKHWHIYSFIIKRK